MRIETFARKSHMDRTRAESLVFVVASTLIALATLFAVTWAAGFDRVAARLHAVQPIWFLVAFGAEAVAYVGYVLSYREVSRVEKGPEMPVRDAVAAVAAGFGAFVAQGGFAVDLHAFRETGLSDREARVRVLGLGALEYALLAPATCIAAIALLVMGVAHPRPALTQGLDSIYVLRCLFSRRRHLAAPIGTAVYWFGDIVCLWSCLQA